jgi:hypothetical protein
MRSVFLLIPIISVAATVPADVSGEEAEDFRLPNARKPGWLLAVLLALC